MLEFKTIETDRYEKAEDGVHVKPVGMIKAQDAFDQLKAHLEKVGLLPDEYFSMNDWKWKGEKELPDYIRASCDVNWGGCEGIYLDISLLHKENNEVKYFSFATGKTLGRSGDDFLRMSRIAAECSMMLNGRGSLVRVSENAYDNIQLTTEEKGLIAKALNAMGDKVADTQGYSAGEKYWDLKEKFEASPSSGFVEVYKQVKEARLSNPVDTKALEEIRDAYGNDLYKEALDTVLKEQQAELYSQLKEAFEQLPPTFNKNQITPYVFYSFIIEFSDEFPEVHGSVFNKLNANLKSLNLSFADDEFIEMFNDIQSQHKPSLSSQIHSAEVKSSNTIIPNKETEQSR